MARPQCRPRAFRWTRMGRNLRARYPARDSQPIIRQKMMVKQGNYGLSSAADNFEKALFQGIKRMVQAECSGSRNASDSIHLRLKV
jgi:hypothetical protein